MVKKLFPFIFFWFLISVSQSTLSNEDVEEVITIGSYLGGDRSDLLPTEIIQKDDYTDLNITNIAEISKYLSSASGSNFQANTLGGIDQGMASITLRGLDQASTLLLLNSKRPKYWHFNWGSNRGMEFGFKCKYFE